MPVGSTYTLKTCVLSSASNVQTLTATYVGPKKQSSTVVDTTKLQADHWQSIDQESAGGGLASKVGDALFFNQRAWLAYHYDYPAGTLSIEEAIPTDSKAVVTCGQTLVSGTAQREGLPEPSVALTTDAGLYTVAPACMNDVTTFDQGALSAAAWAKAQGFQATLAPSAQSTAMIGKFTRSGTTLAIWLGCASGACTVIIVRDGV